MEQTHTIHHFIAALMQGGMNKTAAVAKIADLCGCKERSVYYWLTGQRNMPTSSARLLALTLPAAAEKTAEK